LFEGKGLSYTETLLTPQKIWATQDSLERNRLNMCIAAFEYMLRHKKPIPPVAVWFLKNNGLYTYIAHDGHHRIWACEKLNIKVPTIKMEYWLDNPDNPILIKRLHFQEINKVCVDLPINEFCNYL
jgi:uncharacterized ParB-like nuclease family protein